MKLKLNVRTLIAVGVLSTTFSFADFVGIVNVFGTLAGEEMVVIKKEATPGTIVLWGSTTAPDGWIVLDGRSSGGDAYLLEEFGSNVPDFSGLFARGLGGNSANLGEYQEDESKSHGHSATFSGNSLPNHDHTVNVLVGHGMDAGTGSSALQPDLGTRTTSAVSAGTPTGNITINAGSNPETRPENVAMVYIMKTGGQ